MRVCLMIEGQEGVTWDDWVRLARLTENTGSRASSAPTTTRRSSAPDADALDAWATLAGLAGDHRADPSRHARLARDVPASQRARTHGRHRRPHLRREDRRRNGIRLVRARACGARLPVPRRKAAVRALRRAGGDRRSLLDGGALRPPRAGVRAPRPASIAATRPEAAPTALLGGTVKPRFAELAARYATEVNTLGAPNDELRERKRELDRACAEAGRDPATLAFSVMTACFLGESRADAVERVGGFLAIRGDDADPEAMLRERRDRWLAGSVDEVVERVHELARSA